jgi:hypothetical protein
MPQTGITRGLTTWKFQDHYVERVMDNAAYTAAHPDDTLVMAGPPRSPDPKTSNITDSSIDSKMLAVGHLQQFQVTQQKPTQPVMAIGSGRAFFVSGKAQGQVTLSRLFLNGRNLLRVLEHNVRRSGLPVGNFDDRPARDPSRQYYVNLDSELYLIPFGLGSLFRDKVHHNIGGLYAELMMITTYAVGITAGQNMVMEQVNCVFDRLLPFFEDIVMEPWAGVGPASLDKVMGWIDQTALEMQNANDSLGNAQPPAA